MIITINIPGFDNNFPVSAKPVGPMFEVSGSQMRCLDRYWWKAGDHSCYFHRSEVTIVRPVLFRFSLAAKDVIPQIDTRVVVRAAYVSEYKDRPCYVVPRSQLLAAGVPARLFDIMVERNGNYLVNIMYTIPAMDKR